MHAFRNKQNTRKGTRPKAQDVPPHPPPRPPRSAFPGKLQIPAGGCTLEDAASDSRDFCAAGTAGWDRLLLMKGQEHCSLGEKGLEGKQGHLLGSHDKGDRGAGVRATPKPCQHPVPAAPAAPAVTLAPQRGGAGRPGKAAGGPHVAPGPQGGLIWVRTWDVPSDKLTVHKDNPAWTRGADLHTWGTAWQPLHCHRALRGHPTPTWDRVPPNARDSRTRAQSQLQPKATSLRPRAPSAWQNRNPEPPVNGHKLGLSHGRQARPCERGPAGTNSRGAHTVRGQHAHAVPTGDTAGVASADTRGAALTGAERRRAVSPVGHWGLVRIHSRGRAGGRVGPGLGTFTPMTWEGSGRAPRSRLPGRPHVDGPTTARRPRGPHANAQVGGQLPDPKQKSACEWGRGWSEPSRGPPPAPPATGLDGAPAPPDTGSGPGPRTPARALPPWGQGRPRGRGQPGRGGPPHVAR